MVHINKKSLKVTLFFATASLFLASCGGSNHVAHKGRAGASSATGWAIDGRQKGIFFKANTQVVRKEVPPGLIYIEGGNFTKGLAQDDVMGEWNNSIVNQHVMSFYIDRTEVTNLMYSEYLNWVSTVFPPSERKYAKIYHSLVPDTMVWADGLSLMDHLVRNYLRHPSYQEYPVVGVNWIQANEFCEWRTNRVNEKILKDYGYLSPDSSYGNFHLDVYLSGGYRKKKKDDYGYGDDEEEESDEEDDPFLDFAKGKRPAITSLITEKYRLPTEVEWEYAATFSLNSERDRKSGERNEYPWENNGRPLANFRQSASVYGRSAGGEGDGYDITAPVKSYPPNDAGLYDMMGNVSEWTMDVYRPTISDNVTLNYFRGNIFQKYVSKKNGELALYKRPKYDTLSNGKLIAIGLPGDPIKKDLDIKDLDNRPNIRSAYAVNQGDGDLASSREYMRFENDQVENKRSSTRKAYNHPENEIVVDENGRIKIKPDPNIRTTRISDKTRVYKGGSWEDYAYSLAPTQRRYLDQGKSTRNIGFRCAMSRLGMDLHIDPDKFYFLHGKGKRKLGKERH